MKPFEFQQKFMCGDIITDPFVEVSLSNIGNAFPRTRKKYANAIQWGTHYTLLLLRRDQVRAYMTMLAWYPHTPINYP